MTKQTIDHVFNLLDNWRHLPKYQLERRADIYFAIFLADALKSHFSTEFNSEVIPEFPLRHGTLGTEVGNKHPNLSVNVDYVAFTTDNPGVYFVELKTDLNSRRTSQDDYLKRAKHLEFSKLVHGIHSIREKTEQTNKYDHLLASLSKLGVENLRNQPEIVYLQPRYDQMSHKEYAHYIYFEEFASLVEGLGELGVRFAKSLREWATVDAGSQPPADP